MADTVEHGDRSDSGEPSDGHDPVPGIVDWLLGVLTGVIGLVLLAIGIGTYTRVDRALIAEAVAREGVQLDGLTQSEFVTAAGPFVDWFAIGVGVTGLASVVGAAAFVVARRRTRHRVSSEGGTTATFWACAVYGGAVTTVVSSFVPFVSAVAGGGVAAHLRDSDSGVRTGAAAGLIGTVLTVPFLAFLAVGVVSGAGAIGESAGGTLLAGVIVFGELIAVALNAGLGALGGFLAARFA